jgi:hypothetical protein
MNILKIAGNCLGYKHSEESKVKIAGSRLGFKVSTQTLNKMSDAKIADNHPFFSKVILLKL